MYFSVSRIDNKNNYSEFVEVSIGSLEPLGLGEIKIIEFSDFACPVCKSNAPIVKRLSEEENVVIYYRLFPLPIHKNSFLAALAASCANEQGKFWEYHNVLFENQIALDKTSLRRYAQQINLDMEQFNSCLDGEKYKADVKKDLNDGKKAGVKGTPTFFVNNERYEGFRDFEFFKNLIEKI